MVNTVFLLRHGIRLNHDDPKYVRHYLKRVGDVPLSHRGIAQAQDTGEYLKGKNVTHIFCSPFFRTLQTAHEVADVLDLEMKVEYGFMEMLNPNWFKKYPDLLSQEERKLIFPKVSADYESFIFPTYPETRDDVYNRVEKTLHKILKNYDGTILIVGHGASVRTSAEVLMHPNSADDFDSKMCALNKYVKRGKKWELEYGTTDHLTEESFA